MQKYTYTCVNLSQRNRCEVFFFLVHTARLVNGSKIITAQTARMQFFFQCEQLGFALQLTHHSPISSATALSFQCKQLGYSVLSFQCKQLGSYTVVNSLQRKQLSWCFILSVQTARLVHCSKLIAAQTAQLVLYPFSANSSAGTLQ